MLMRSLVVILLACGAGFFLILPPRAQTVAESVGTRSVRGVVHVHTRRQDGTGTVEQIAQAARAAGLSFVIVTDHGNGARLPEPPSYVSNVLVIDAVEISTTGGHVVALGLAQAPYPLGGEPRDVVEDIHRLGGWAIAAHPGSSKPELAWQDWDAPIDALEWLNGDSEWRDEGYPSLLRVLLTYPVRPAEALTVLLDRPDAVMTRWDALSQTRPVMALAGSDAHARVGLTSIGEPYDARASLPLPSYRSVFSALSVNLDDVSLTGNAITDSAAVLDAVRAGRMFSSIDGLARQGSLSFTAANGEGSVGAGQSLAVSGPVTLSVAVAGPREARVTLIRNGQPVKTTDALRFEESVGATPAVYRVEVSLPEAGGAHPVPWLVSNPIWIGGVPAGPAAATPASATTRVPWSMEQLGEARIEKSPASEGATSVTRVPGARELLFRYALGGRTSEHPYAAAVVGLPAPLADDTRVRFTGRADRPMRVSVQLRRPGAGDGERWRRSIYLDETPREVDLGVKEMRPVSTGDIGRRLSGIDTVLFVVDDVNTPLGNGGRIWIRDLELVR